MEIKIISIFNNIHIKYYILKILFIFYNRKCNHNNLLFKRLWIRRQKNGDSIIFRDMLISVSLAMLILRNSHYLHKLLEKLLRITQI